MTEGYDLLGVLNWSDHFPILDWLDLQGVRKRYGSLVDKVNVVVRKIILEHGVKRVVEGEDKTRFTKSSTDFVDGQSAVSICRRLTRPKDYHAKTEQGKETNKDRICIDVLEREMRRNPMAGDACMSSHTMADDLHMKLLYLENRGMMS